MKTRYFFILALLCLIFSTQALPAQSLNTKVSLTVKEASLAQVLQKMQHKYGFRFSYLNNEIPAKTRFSADIKERLLSDVLDVLLENTDLGYRENKGQIIIKKGFPKNKPKTTTFQKLNPPVETRPKPASKPTSSLETGKALAVKPTPDAEPKDSQSEVVVAEVLPDSPRPSDEAREDSLPGNHVIINGPNFFDKLKARLKTNESRAAASDSILKNSTHFGFIYPASTNGIYANKYVNDLSAQLLIGTAAGNKGAEFAGVGNIDQSYVNGVQFAGVFNVVQGKPTGNIGEDSVRGDRIVNGAQFAGVMNTASGRITGGQFAGVLNTAQTVKGVQAAGVLNVADTIKGVQFGGVLNVARVVKGAQFGFINIADSVSGVSIGLLSLVKNGGYKRLELFASNDFEANIAYKIGVPKFHTIIALGAEMEDEKRWGYGTGFGSEWSLSKVVKVNTDLVSYYVVERSYSDFPTRVHDDYELNLLNKFRLLGTIQIGKHFALFGGPTYNVMVSQYRPANSDNVGSTLAPSNTFYNHTSSDGTNVKMWIGFNAGLRF